MWTETLSDMPIYFNSVSRQENGGWAFFAGFDEGLIPSADRVANTPKIRFAQALRVRPFPQLRHTKGPTRTPVAMVGP